MSLLWRRSWLAGVNRALFAGVRVDFALGRVVVELGVVGLGSVTGSHVGAVIADVALALDGLRRQSGRAGQRQGNRNRFVYRRSLLKCPEARGALELERLIGQVAARRLL